VTRIAVIACALALAGLAALPPRALAADSARPAVPAGSRYVLGKPFQFDGVWYRPGVDYAYDASGLAVVYDAGFAGGRTTDGETYDDRALTAAHKTLPLPSLVQVTNLDNGRVVTVRINDRGPFVDDQVIQLSGAAAAVLGIAGGAKARVRVQILAKESRALALAYGATAPGDYEPAPSLAAMPAPQLSIQPLPAGGAPAPPSSPPPSPPQSAQQAALPNPPAPAATAPTPAPAPGISPAAGNAAQPAASQNKPAASQNKPAASQNKSAAPAKPAAAPTPSAASVAATAGAAAASNQGVSPAPSPQADAAPPGPPSLKPVVVIEPATPPGANPTATQTAALPPQPAANSAATMHASSDQLFAHAAGFFIQTGAFANPADAERLRDKLANLGKSKIVTVPVGALSFSAVMIGPIGSLDEARRKLGEVAAQGYKDAVLIAQ
jgi:rare lipoprotein A